MTFILNAQKMGLKILANNTRVDVISMHDLGTCYAQDDSLDNFTNMNKVFLKNRQPKLFEVYGNENYETIKYRIR